MSIARHVSTRGNGGSNVAADLECMVFVRWATANSQQTEAVEAGVQANHSQGLGSWSPGVSGSLEHSVLRRRAIAQRWWETNWGSVIGKQEWGSQCEQEGLGVWHLCWEDYRKDHQGRQGLQGCWLCIVSGQLTTRRLSAHTADPPCSSQKWQENLFFLWCPFSTLYWESWTLYSLWRGNA